MTYIELEKLLFYGKILTNLYIPTESGTTEIDLVYISTNGIYVIESKNYSGWIFGNEKNRFWTSVIYSYKKKFLNPIWQNKKHITYLKNYVECPIHSLIIFSQRCELKKIENIKTATVLKRDILYNYLNKELNGKNILSHEEINKIYEKLKPFTNIDDETKQKHIELINKYKSH